MPTAQDAKLRFPSIPARFCRDLPMNFNAAEEKRYHQEAGNMVVPLIWKVVSPCADRFSRRRHALRRMKAVELIANGGIFRRCRIMKRRPTISIIYGMVCGSNGLPHRGGSSSARSTPLISRNVALIIPPFNPPNTLSLNSKWLERNNSTQKKRTNAENRI